MGAIRLWRGRGKARDRPADHAAHRTTTGVVIAAAITGFILTAFSVGYSYGKARALEDNLAGEQARARLEATAALNG